MRCFFWSGLKGAESGSCMVVMGGRRAGGRSRAGKFHAGWKISRRHCNLPYACFPPNGMPFGIRSAMSISSIYFCGLVFVYGLFGLFCYAMLKLWGMLSSGQLAGF